MSPRVFPLWWTLFENFIHMLHITYTIFRIYQYITFTITYMSFYTSNISRIFHQRETLVDYSSRKNVFSWYYWYQAQFSGHFCSSVGRPAHIRIHQVAVYVYEYICFHRYTHVSTGVYLCMYICVHICIYSTFVSI